MMRRSFGSASVRVELFAIAVLTGVQPAWGSTVYLETFAGETSYPTTPEVDTLGMAA